MRTSRIRNLSAKLIKQWAIGKAKKFWADTCNDGQGVLVVLFKVIRILSPPTECFRLFILTPFFLFNDYKKSKNDIDRMAVSL
jgi:hypothetical protein